MKRRKVKNAEINEMSKIHNINNKIAKKHYGQFIAYYNRLISWTLVNEITDKQKNDLLGMYYVLNRDIYGLYKTYTLQDISQVLFTPPKILLGNNYQDFINKTDIINKKYLNESAKDAAINFIKIFELNVDKHKQIALQQYKQIDSKLEINDIILRNARLHSRNIIPISINNYVYQKSTTIRMNDGKELINYNGNMLQKKSNIVKSIPLVQIIKKQWVASFVNTRPSHANVHGQIVLLNEDFRIGSEMAEYPRSRNLSPKESYGCNCEVILTI